MLLQYHKDEGDKAQTTIGTKHTRDRQKHNHADIYNHTYTEGLKVKEINGTA